MRTNRLLIGLSVIVIALVTGIGLFAADKDASAGLAMTEMSVTKLTCGACVANITNALADLPGIESVEISVTTGRSQVLFNPELVDAEQIAQVVTATGYPATVTRQLSNEQYLAIQNEEAKLAEIYVAKIGDRLLGRDEFELLVKQKMLASGYQDRPEMQAQIASQTWQSLKQRMLLLGDAEKNQVVVQDGEVDLKITQLQKMPNYESFVAGFSSADEFFRQTKEDMIINKNIQENVLAGVVSPAQKQARFNQWFQDLISNAPVTIYDTALKQTSSQQKGSCGSGGGGCCG